MNQRKKQIIFIICYLAYTAIYVARLNLSMASPEMIDIKVLTTAQVGLLGSVFSVIYAIGRLVNGTVSDTTPPWIMISSGLALAGISNIVIGFFPPFIGIMIMWGLNAFAQSMLWSSILLIVASMYDEKIAKSKTSYMVTAVATGNILGIIVNSFIITKFGVRYAFIIPGAITIIFCALIIITTKKIEVKKVEKAEHTPVYKLFGINEIKLILAPAMLHGAIKDNISLWMAVYFVKKFAIDLNESTYFVLFIPVIGFIGRMMYNVFYKMSKGREHAISTSAFILCALLSVPMCLGGVNPIVSAICLSGLYAAVSVINTTILSIFPIHFAKSGNVASVSGIMDFCTYLGAGISCMAYGFLIDKLGFESMFITWAVISLISVFFTKKLDKGQQTSTN